MNCSDLQLLADARLADAEVLLNSGRWSAAYYLLGYAVECALKAIAAKQFREPEVPDKKAVNDFYTHDLERLLGISGAGPAFDLRAKADPAFLANWSAVCGWNEASRYNHLRTETEARDMFAAVSDPASGVLPWLKTLY